MAATKIISVNELWQFFNLSSSLFCIIGKDGYFRHVNPAVTDLLGYTEEEILSTPCIFFIHPKDVRASLIKGKELCAGTNLLHFCNRFRTSNGDYKWFNWTATSATNEGYIYAVAQDWTEKNRLQEQLIQERTEKDNSLLQATIYGRDQERQEIGRELHDNINQQIAAARLYQETALQHEEMRSMLIEKSIEILDNAIQEIRNLSHSLVGPDITNLNLIDAVTGLLNNINCTHTTAFSFEQQCSCDQLSEQLKVTIFRIIQEQANNIMKHAHASHASIRILIKYQHVFLLINDDGIGFDTGKTSNGIGLKNIISRATSLNGKVEFESRLKKGTSLSVCLPLAGARPK